MTSITKEVKVKINIVGNDDATDEIKQVKNSISGMKSSIIQASLAVDMIKKSFDLMKDAANFAFDVIKDSTFAYADFSDQLRLTGLLIGDAGGETISLAEKMNLLSDEAKQAGIDSIFSAQQMAEGYKEIAAIGDYTTQTVIDIGNAVKDLAQATGMKELGTASSIVARAMNQFSISGDRAFVVADVLAKAANISALEVTDIGTALGFSASAAAAAKMTLEETVAVLASLSNAGMSASMAGTSLRQIINRISDPTSEAKSVMTQLGVSFFDTSGKMKSMSEIVNLVIASTNNATMNTEELAEVRSNLNEEDKGLLDTMIDLTDEMTALAVSKIFGVRAGSAMLALTNQENLAFEGQGTTLDKLTGQLEDAIGEQEGMGFAAQTADSMMEGFGAEVDKTEESISNFKLSLGEAFAPLTTDLMIGIQGFFNELRSQADSGILDPFVESIRGVLGDVNELFESFISDLSETDFLANITASFEGLENAVDRFINALTEEDITESTAETADAFVEMANSIGSSMSDIIEPTVAGIGILVDVFGFAFTEIGQAIEKYDYIFGGMLEHLGVLFDIVRALEPILKPLGKILISQLLMPFGLLSILSKGLAGGLKIILFVLESLEEPIKIIGHVLDLVAESWQKITLSLPIQAFNTVVNVLFGIVDLLLNLDDLLNSFGDNFKVKWDTMLTDFATGALGMLTSWDTTLDDMLGSAGSFVADLLGLGSKDEPDNVAQTQTYSRSNIYERTEYRDEALAARGIIVDENQNAQPSVTIEKIEVNTTTDEPEEMFNELVDQVSERMTYETLLRGR